jgi:tetratricopeptide (TPR) repeat protein
MSHRPKKIVNLETPLSDRITEERRKSELSFSRTKKAPQKRPDLASVDLLVEEGHKGLAISILENWLIYNEGEEELVKLVSLFDESTPIQISLSWCRDLISLKPSNQFALCRLLELQILDEAYSSAFETATIIVELADDSVKGNEFLTNYYISQEDWDLAISHSEKCLSINPNDSKSLRNLAISSEAIGAEEKATDAWEKWVNSDSQIIEEYELASAFFLSKERFSVSAKISSMGLEINPANVSLLETIILAYSFLHEWSLCLAKTRKLSLIDRNSSIAIWHRKKSNFNLGITFGNETLSGAMQENRWFSMLKKDDSENDLLRWFNLI